MALATPLYALRSFFTDKCGTPLAGGLVYSYENNTLTPKNTYIDASLQVPNTNPVVLDETGKADIFLSGVYRFQVFSRDGVLIEDKSDVFNIVDLSKVAEKAKVDEQFEQQQQAIDLKAPKAITDILQQKKADKLYVDTALTGLTNGAAKFYPTLAEANADIANIGLKDKVEVGEVENGGIYYKATESDSTLTKSPFDPVRQGMEFFYEQTKFFETVNLVNPSQNIDYGYFVYNLLNKPAPGTGFDNYYIGQNYYPAKVGDSFWLQGVSQIQFYTADKTPIWTVNITSETAPNYVYKIPESWEGHSLANCAFIRIGTNLGQVAFPQKAVSLGPGEVLPNKVPDYLAPAYGFKDNSFTGPIYDQYDETLESKLAKRLVGYENLVNPAQAVTQGYYSATEIAGAGQQGFEDYYVGLDYYPAKVGDKFWLSNVHNMQFCRLDKSAIWGTYGTGLAEYIVDGVLTIPNILASVPISECAYIRIGSNRGSTAFADGLVAMGRGDTKPLAPPKFGEQYYEPTAPLIAGINNALGSAPTSLNEKKWVAMGDSITYEAPSYADQLAFKHNATLTKHSKIGAMIAKPFVANPDVMILSEEYLNIDTSNPPDIITIAAGVNDDNIIGSFSDRANSTFYGALHVLLAGLRSRFLDTRIGFIAPIPYMKTTENVRYIDGDMNNRPYLKYKAIKEVCAYYGIPVWNGNTEFGASPYDSEDWKYKYMRDGLHPTHEGQIWYANRVEDFILRLAK